jgi:hypothetical protein
VTSLNKLSFEYLDANVPTVYSVYMIAGQMGGDAPFRHIIC